MILSPAPVCLVSLLAARKLVWPHLLSSPTRMTHDSCPYLPHKTEQTLNGGHEATPTQRHAQKVSASHLWGGLISARVGGTVCVDLLRFWSDNKACWFSRKKKRFGWKLEEVVEVGRDSKTGWKVHKVIHTEREMSESWFQTGRSSRESFRVGIVVEMDRNIKKWCRITRSSWIWKKTLWTCFLSAEEYCRIFKHQNWPSFPSSAFSLYVYNLCSIKSGQNGAGFFWNNAPESPEQGECSREGLFSLSLLSIVLAAFLKFSRLSYNPPEWAIDVRGGG